MGITSILRALPLKKQTVVKSLVLVTLLFIVYQLTFVAELSESAKPRSTKQGSSTRQNRKGILKEKVHPKDLLLNQEMTKDARTSNLTDKKKIELSKIEDKKKSKVPVIDKENDSERSRYDKNKIETDVKFETSKVFVCRKSGKVITEDKVNDDYCDCPEDGSDEPRTNACINSVFSCLKVVHGFPKSIPAAWVNDGVCDCCDGSDEWQKKVMDTLVPLELQKKVGRFMSPCPNRCP